MHGRESVLRQFNARVMWLLHIELFSRSRHALGDVFATPPSRVGRIYWSCLAARRDTGTGHAEWLSHALSHASSLCVRMAISIPKPVYANGMRIFIFDADVDDDGIPLLFYFEMCHDYIDGCISSLSHCRQRRFADAAFSSREEVKAAAVTAVDGCAGEHAISLPFLSASISLSAGIFLPTSYWLTTRKY